MGSVGKIAADYIIKSLDCRRLMPIYSRGFPPQVMVSEGLTSTFQAEILAPCGRNDLILVSGDAQPMDVVNMNILACDILAAASSMGTNDIVTLAAYVSDLDEKVVGTATDIETLEELSRIGIHKIDRGFIGGLNGILAGMAPQFGMRGLCILGTTSGDRIVDLVASKNLVNAVIPLFGLDIPLNGLEFAEATDEEEDNEAQDSEEFGMLYR